MSHLPKVSQLAPAVITIAGRCTNTRLSSTMNRWRALSASLNKHQKRLHARLIHPALGYIMSSHCSSFGIASRRATCQVAWRFCVVTDVGAPLYLPSTPLCQLCHPRMRANWVNKCTNKPSANSCTQLPVPLLFCYFYDYSWLHSDATLWLYVISRDSEQPLGYLPVIKTLSSA